MPECLPAGRWPIRAEPRRHDAGKLSVALKKAVEWDVIDRMPCRIQLLPVANHRKRLGNEGAAGGTYATGQFITIAAATGCRVQRRES